MLAGAAPLHQGDLNLWEYIAVGGILLYAAVAKRARRWLPPALKPWQGATLTGVATLVLRIALLWRMPVPIPIHPDEFSYLLQGDTFAHGRLTNPTHPMWRHFETIHVIHHPTYASMYPPMQGLILALGQILGHPLNHPWTGVLLTCCLMSAAITWMLYGWLPPRWALLGGMIAVLRYRVLGIWINSNWGGPHAALGGALVLGAVPRLRRGAGWGCAASAGLGFAILANSRPLEGLVFALAVGATLTWPVFKRLLIPCTIVLAIAAGLMGVYFARVTGSPTHMPYQVNYATYGWPMTFPWLPAKPVALRFKQMIEYYEWETVLNQQFHSLPLFLAQLGPKFRHMWGFFLGAGLSIPLAMFGRRVFHDRRTRGLLLPLALTFFVALSAHWSVPHYLAPATCAIVAVAVQTIRHLRVWRTSGMFLSRAILALLAASFAVRALNLLPMGTSPISWCCVTPGNSDRAAMLAKLEKRPGKQLVIVRYAPEHYVHMEWVYNEASIDDAKVVWAREMTATENRDLIAYFHDRTPLLLEPDAHPPVLTRYSAP